LVKNKDLIPHTKAVGEMHFPTSSDDLELAKKRLGFEEVFELSLAALLNKYELAHEHALLIPFKEKLAKDFVASLPFKLTDAQRKVVWTIYKDMEQSYPMNRLVEGDVGSGKTVCSNGGNYGDGTRVPGGVYGANGNFSPAACRYTL
jgi:ATP-dependent DNA helicase RecG